MPVTMLDGILIGVTLFSAVLAMVRGFSGKSCQSPHG